MASMVIEVEKYSIAVISATEATAAIETIAATETIGTTESTAIKSTKLFSKNFKVLLLHLY